MSVAIVTGVGRRQCIGAEIALRLASAGHDLVISRYRPFDESVPYGGAASESHDVVARIRAIGRTAELLDVDFAEHANAARLFDAAAAIGAVEILVCAHAHHARGGLLDVDVPEFDRHMAVNARGVLLLIQEFARRYCGNHGAGRIITLTSDAVVGSLAYGASKGAIDRITEAAAVELAPVGITANAVCPGPNDTGWMSAEFKRDVQRHSLMNRVGTPADTADLVAFLCSSQGGWVTGQLLHSDGGHHATL